MLQKFSTNRQAFFLLLLFVLLFLESTIYENGSIFLAFLGIGLLYIGLKRAPRSGKGFLWTGVLFFGIAVLSMWTLRLLIFGTALYLMIRLWRGTEAQQELFIEPTPDEGPIKNKLFAAQSTPVEAYEWKDVHVQGLIGDLLIDATQTVLPKRASIISVRQGIGKVRIIVPYEIPVRVYYSTLYGEGRFFTNAQQRIVNGTVHLHDGYGQAGTGQAELIISLSTWIGDVEVIRR